MASTDAIPVPRKNTAYRFYFAIRKPSDSTLITTWAGMDSEVSLDGAAFADCTNEATEIGTSGCGYIDLTSSEMNADSVVLKVTVTNTGAVPLVFTFLPESAGDYRVADTQKVDVETIKTQAVTCAAGVTVGVYVGGTGAAALASTALSTATWTGTLATNIGTTNTTVATNLDATVSSRGTSTLTQTQVTGGAYALNSSSFGFNAALDFTTTQKAATLARVTLVDTTTTNTDMRGTNSAALAATALSTAQWTNALATALGVTNADLLNGGRLDLIFDLILADTNELQTNQGNWLTATGFSTHSAADVLTALGTGSWATSLAQSSVWTSTLAAALSPIRSNTAQAGSSTTITLDASASAVTDFYVPSGIYLTGGTGAGQFRTIDDYNGTTKVATVSEPWYTTPDNTTTWAIRPEGIFHADIRQLGGNELSAGYLKAIADYYGLNTKIPGHVESIATDAISAASLAADAVAEIQSGLATASELLLVKDRVSYCLTVLVGACADAGTSAETYVHAIGGETFTVDFAGLDDTGTRTTTTLSKV